MQGVGAWKAYVAGDAAAGGQACEDEGDGGEGLGWGLGLVVVVA